MNAMKIIENPKSGHRYKLLMTGENTNGERLEMEVSYPADSSEPPGHFHPFQTEYFRILNGEISVRMEDEVRVYHAGESFIVPPKVIHSMWNSSDEETLVHWTVTPALKTAQLFETLATLARLGKTNDKGSPGLLQAALTIPYFSDEIRLTSPPAWLQKLIFGLPAPLARILGYHPALPVVGKR